MSIDVRIGVLNNGRKLSYSEYGVCGGKTLFYFHGWPSSRLCAAGLDNAAKKLHIRLIAVDRPGYGFSDYQDKRTFLDWPDDVTGLANTLKIKKFSIIGVSGGGPYAAVCAYKIPERLHSVGIVVGLAPTYIPGILNNMPFLTKAYWENYPRFPWLRKGAALFHYINAKYGPSLGLHRFMFGAKKDKQELSNLQFRKQIRLAYQEAFRKGYKGVEQDLAIYTNNWGFDLQKIKTPVVLFYGENDKNVSLSMGEYYHSKIKNSKLFTYPNEGHLIIKTHTEEILRAIMNN